MKIYCALLVVLITLHAIKTCEIPNSTEGCGHGERCSISNGVNTCLAERLDQYCNESGSFNRLDCPLNYVCATQFQRTFCVLKDIPLCDPGNSSSCSDGFICQSQNGINQCVDEEKENVPCTPNSTEGCRHGGRCLVLNGVNTCLAERLDQYCNEWDSINRLPCPTNYVCASQFQKILQKTFCVLKDIPLCDPENSSSCSDGFICQLQNGINQCVDEEKKKLPCTPNSTEGCGHGERCSILNGENTCLPKRINQYCNEWDSINRLPCPANYVCANKFQQIFCLLKDISKCDPENSSSCSDGFICQLQNGINQCVEEEKENVPSTPNSTEGSGELDSVKATDQKILSLTKGSDNRTKKIKMLASKL